eukprot:7647286-Alexandrium_andersonii.AAC.1
MSSSTSSVPDCWESRFQAVEAPHPADAGPGEPMAAPYPDDAGLGEAMAAPHPDDAGPGEAVPSPPPDGAGLERPYSPL